MNQAETQQLPNRDRSRKLLLAMCIGIALAVSLGAALDNYAAGGAIGAGVGVSLGMAFSGQRREPSKPLTLVGIVLLAVGVVLLAVVMSLVVPDWWCDYPIHSLFPGCR